MKKILSVHLNGKSFQMEEDAHDLLRSYLDTAEAQLKENPDKTEIVADLEQAIGDKCVGYLSAHKDVMTSEEIKKIITEMGPVEGAGLSEKNESTHTETGSAPKKLYLIREGSMIAGVCNGLASYFTIDVTIVRIVFVALTLVTGGAWIIVYLILMFVVPYATTPEQRAAASGTLLNAQEIINQAKLNYEQFADRHQWRRRKREWKENARSWRRAHRYEMRAVHSPFLGLLSAFLSIVWILALIALIQAGGAMIAGTFIPLWLGIIFLVIIFRALFWPISAARYNWYGYHQSPFGARGGGLWPAIVDLLSLVSLMFAGWFIYVNYPSVREFVGTLITGIQSGIWK
jgi:phage shock protein PspC (stress-responsive transcriptional regulator)